MNKPELVRRISEESGLNLTQAESAVNAVVKVVTDSLAEGTEVKLVGFGKFTTITRKARTGRNPQNGEVLQLPETKTAKFVPGELLVKAVRS